MAKKAKDVDDINVEVDENGDEEKGGGISSFFIALIIIVIWLAIFALLIKMDVGGVGTMLRPFLKNVPVINMILPEASDEEVMQETGYKYKSLAEAVERIKVLEKQLADYQNGENMSTEEIDRLKAEIERLKGFEENQEYYQELKDKFDREIVFNDNAPDIEEYKKWYEEISADNAAEIYEEVVEKIQYSQKVKDWASTYAQMEPENAAAILEEMTGDTDLVATILLSMEAEERAAILAEMDTVFAAKLTKIMYP